MHPSVLAQDEISAQEGLELLKAYTGIRDPSVRAKILTWVMNAHAGATGLADKALAKHPLVDEDGVGH